MARPQRPRRKGLPREGHRGPMQRARETNTRCEASLEWMTLPVYEPCRPACPLPGPFSESGARPLHGSKSRPQSCPKRPQGPRSSRPDCSAVRKTRWTSAKIPESTSPTTFRAKDRCIVTSFNGRISLLRGSRPRDMSSRSRTTASRRPESFDVTAHTTMSSCPATRTKAGCRAPPERARSVARGGAARGDAHGARPRGPRRARPDRGPRNVRAGGGRVNAGPRGLPAGDRPKP